MQKEFAPDYFLRESPRPELDDTFLNNASLEFSVTDQPYILAPDESPRIWEMARQSFAQLFGDHVNVSILTPAAWYVTDQAKREMLTDVARRRHQVLVNHMGWDIYTSEHTEFGGLGLPEADLHQHDDLSPYSMTLLGQSEQTGELLSTTRLVKPIVDGTLAAKIAEISESELVAANRPHLTKLWRVCVQFLSSTQLLGFREQGGLNAAELDVDAASLDELKVRIRQALNIAQLMIAERVLSVERQVPLYTLPENSPQRRLQQLFSLLALTPIQATMMISVANTKVDHFLIQTTTPFLQLLQQGYGEAIQPLWQTTQSRHQIGDTRGVVADVCHTVLIDVPKAWQLLIPSVHAYYLEALSKLQSDQAIIAQKVQYIQDCRRL